MEQLTKAIKNRIRFFLWKTGIQKTVKPPHLAKEKIVRFYKNKYNIHVLVETGTYEGEMVEAFKREFREIFSIELNSLLVKSACERFSSFENVKIIEGDSTKELATLLKQLPSPCLFWLDAHYSGGKTSRGEKETPVLEEVELITKHSNKNIILIDDADNFGKGDYPSLSELKKIMGEDSIMRVESDVIQIFPGESKK